MFRIIVIFWCIWSGTGNAAAQPDLVACGQDQVLIIDSKKSDADSLVVKWSWKVKEAKDLPPAYQKWMVPLDECKPLEGGKKLLLTSSSGGVVLLEVASKKVLFYAYSPMAHSADILPGNRLAVALSTHKAGNSLEVYDLAEPEKRLFKDSLYSGHGAVWNKYTKRLYALGFDELRAYKLQKRHSRKPALVLEKTWKLPDEGGHDLSWVTAKEMLVSTHHNVYSFDLSEEQFRVFQPLADKHNVKSVNYNPHTNQLVYTQAEESWWTNRIYLKNPDKVISVPYLRLYKVRVME